MSSLKSIRLPVSANLKLTLVGLAFLIMAGTLFYTQQLVEELKQSERKTVKFYANTFQRLTNSTQSVADLSDLVFEMGRTIDFPIIFTDADQSPLPSSYDGAKAVYTEWVKNVDFDTSASLEEQARFLKERVTAMAEVYEPLPIYAVVERDSTIINYIFYDESDIIKQIRLLPYVGMVIIAMFILVGYISFSHIKRNEQSNIWVGMAKETAHQLGTPLSSLLGWIELLRYMPEDTDQVLEAADEMERDVERLNKIALRFSKIGSAAEVKPVELNGVMNHVVEYFTRRLPHLGKKVSLTLEASEPVWAEINVDLFEWVFENLVRNAADAIDHTDGHIRLSVRRVRDIAVIDVSDNGRGINPKIRKDIFRPGFSTKKRGWGLGLSLAKRIVEEYHGGKIVIKQSSSAGTTFRIRIPAIDSPEEPTVVDARSPHPASSDQPVRT